METAPPAPRSRLARVVIALAGVEVAVLFGFIALFASMLSSGEQLSRNIAQGVIGLAAVPLALALVALVLGLRQRTPKIALTLTLLVLPVGAVFFLFA